MTGKPRILVVEDEDAIRVGVCDVLAFKGFEPVGVGHGDEGLRRALDEDWAVLVLDVMLPGLDGFSICQRVREARPHQAILMLTAKGAESDVLEGFRAGADDYVGKPFSVAQLMARIQALARRAAAEPAMAFRAGPLRVDPSRLHAEDGDVTVELTTRDVEVFARLVRLPGEVVSRTDLLRDVWGYERADALETRCVDMHIAKLRKKLRPLCAGAGDDVIETVRGAGYRLKGD